MSGVRSSLKECSYLAVVKCFYQTEHSYVINHLPGRIKTHSGTPVFCWDQPGWLDSFSEAILEKSRLLLVRFMNVFNQRELGWCWKRQGEFADKLAGDKQNGFQVYWTRTWPVGLGTNGSSWDSCEVPPPTPPPPPFISRPHRPDHTTGKIRCLLFAISVLLL